MAPSKGRRTKSVIREHFEPVIVKLPGSDVHSTDSRCIHCKKVLAGQVPTNMRTHIARKHKEVFDKIESKLGKGSKKEKKIVEYSIKDLSPPNN